MGKGHSKDAVFSIGGSPLSHVTSVTLSVDGQVADITVLGDSYKQYVRGQVDATMSVEGIYDDPAIGTVFLRYAEGTAMPIIYYPQGTASGKARFSGTAFITSYEVPASMDSAVTWSCNLQLTGSILPGTA